MPTYKVTDPNTGRTLRLTGDSPPTEAELEEIFQSVGGGQEKPQTPARQATIAPAPPLSGMEVLSGAVRNFPESAGQLAKDVAQPFMHPVETGKAMYSLGKGIMQKMIPGEQADEATADAVGQFFAERYGGLENVKRTMAEDPAGFLADASMLMTGGGTAVARAPGVIGKAGQAVKAAGQAIDPIAAAGKAAKVGAQMAGKGTAAAVGGLGTWTGPESMMESFRAGRKSPEAYEAFKAGARKKEASATILDQAQTALQNMRQSKQGGYAAAEGKWQRNTKTIPFEPIVSDFFTLKRELTQHRGLNKAGKETNKVFNEIEGVLNDWAEAGESYHNAGGLDALKQRIDDIKVPQDNDVARKAVTAMRNKVKDEIVANVPEYAEAMKQYEELHKLEKEIGRTLSIGNQASIDTTLRKLQSVMRNNANTSYAHRGELLNSLIERGGAPNLMPMIAGQQMSEVFPRSLGKWAGITAAASNPNLIPFLPIQSPRLMGETAAAMGAGSRLTEQLLRGLGITPEMATGAGHSFFQTGRLADELQRRR